MEKEQLYEYAGRLRRELHALVDQHMDDFVKRIGDGNLSSKTVMACSLAGPDYFFKGKKPVSVVLPGGEERPCKTWREAVSMILKDCNADAKMHGRLLAISGKVAGRERVILGGTDRGMDKPLKIDDGIYFESYFDTQYLLKVMKERVLDAVGYDYSGILLSLRLLHHISRMIQNRLEDERRGKGGTIIERKLRRQSEEKKQALGIRL